MSEEFDLSTFEISMVIRQMKFEDIKRLLSMQELCFPGMEPWEESHLKSHLEMFPEGQLSCGIGRRNHRFMFKSYHQLR